MPTPYKSYLKSVLSAVLVVTLLFLLVFLYKSLQKPKSVITNSVAANLNYGISAGSELSTLQQNDLDHYMSMLNDLGIKWIRFDFEWGKIEPQQGQFNWQITDRIVGEASKYNIKILGTLAYAPSWAQDPACRGNFSCEPANPQDFADFAYQAASRYKVCVSNWEIWNEPNYPQFWSPQPDALKYGDLVKNAYPEIKRANPNSTVISGGLAPDTTKSGGNISPVTFIQQLYSEGFDHYFDAIAVHPYTYPATPSASAVKGGWYQMIAIHNFIKQNPDRNKRIWITEYGAPTGGPGSRSDVNPLIGFNYGTDFISEEAQGEMLTEALNYYNNNQDWLGGLFWYSLRDISSDPSSTENFYGLLRSDWSPKPAFDILKSEINGHNQ